jgi:hypothetical protein
MNGKLTGLLLCASLAGIAGPAVRSTAAVVPQNVVAMDDGTQPVPPPYIPPQAIAATLDDGTQPVPPPYIPPAAVAATFDDGTQPVPPPYIPPAVA